MHDLQLYNQQGQMVLRKGAHAVSLEIGHLPAGMYLLKVITAEGQVIKRVVKE